MYYRNAANPETARAVSIVTRSLEFVRSFWILGRHAHRRTSVTARMASTDAPGVAVLQILKKEVLV